MNDTFPKDRSLGDPERLRLFKKDAPLVTRVSEKLGIRDDEAKRRAVHVGLKKIAELLGIREAA